MAGSVIFLLGLWVQANAQEVQSASDQELTENQLVEMLSDDNVLEQVADKLIDKLSERAMGEVDLSAVMDETTLAKAAKGAPAPPPKRKAAPAPADDEGGLDFGQIWANLGGGVTPSVDKNTPTRGQRGTTLGSNKPSVFDRIRNGKAKAEPAFYGAAPMRPPVVQPAPMRPHVNMRLPFANLEADDEEPESANVVAVLVASFFAGVALTLGVHRLWNKHATASASTLQGYEPLHG
eukprot:gnl/MRDRNA2_/MRDRNA2_85108_c0_seq1.p1 gnl/MRDRNA2_/MRDRNA2_85108_c0~~gnl/MRDRNA2_/MRDRNA2_85108_c0_seq1.p1  ORF type:complete len:236 (+),score=63.62 gnl/MRDRNA2_/MRDRNA2_85108_c0_seq1:108-815(+)